MAFVRRDFSHRVRVAAWSLAGFTMLVLVAALVLAGLDAGRMTVGRVAFYGIAALAVVVYAGAGRLIASRVPGNAAGWLRWHTASCGPFPARQFSWARR